LKEFIFLEKSEGKQRFITDILEDSIQNLGRSWDQRNTYNLFSVSKYEPKMMQYLNLLYVDKCNVEEITVC